ncbi:hypothetical protein LEP1GSC188_1037 [Leptospira weilii serovar Topaz str. LT2116]|uniref:Uncharacterized protein n=1 Tax=Leptospira weilii serovar Topaz str. LT2116 TaxID=1088540 RepID=M3GUY2_9LEPT|nr:hypothetical protein LEP1GSC188_1037 [Leptospira weilii serovar Topaz str. LT2116]
MKVLITVKTYPAISTKYGETVCTAGFTEEGKWIRIYPLPFRKINYKGRFHKYQWIQLDLKRNTSDFRPESFRPLDYQKVEMVGEIPSDGNLWTERRKVVLQNVYINLDRLISEAKDRKVCTSLTTFKPTQILDFTYEKVDDNWDPKKIPSLESEKQQGSLFESENEEDIENFEVVDKVPYQFRFKFADGSGKISHMMIEDWETGMLYWNSLLRHQGDEHLACEDVKKKYFEDFAKTKDYYFFLGTIKQYHNVSPNPFVIIGGFRPKPIQQLELGF